MAKSALLIIDGPSAVGKSTIVQNLLHNDKVAFTLVNRYVTRRKRESDEIYEMYKFITNKEFDNLVKSKAFLEFKCYKFGMCYGIIKAEIESELLKKCNVLAIINLGNYPVVKNSGLNSFGVFLNASLNTIEERLIERNSHTEEQIQERIDNAKKSHDFYSDYDLIVNNENTTVDDVVETILSNFIKFLKFL